MIAPCFQNQQSRNEAWKAAGKPGRRTSIHNQLLHPQYVADWTGPVETGFGNTQYKTHFGVLYSWQ